MLCRALQQTARSQSSERYVSKLKHLTDINADIISEQEEAALLRYFGRRLLEVCSTLRLARNVLASSMAYLRRFYVHGSILEHDPQRIAPTALYLACKCCDSYLSAAELGRLMGLPQEILLRSELTLLQGLHFDIVVHSAYRALEGCLQDSFFSSFSSDQMRKVKEVAYRSLDSLHLSDAPLIFTPGQLGLCALRQGLQDIGEDSIAYISSVAKTANKDVDSLKRVVDAALRMGEEANSLDAIDVANVDRRLKEFRRKVMAASTLKA